MARVKTIYTVITLRTAGHQEVWLTAFSGISQEVAQEVLKRERRDHEAFLLERRPGENGA